ncbi:putative late blight resistance protein homolog R1A-3 [Salvia splendens]|uniref:putative late blight resistance protein homolog R1A-3 n=1 Tax=Salvia splendens TaxID=180675 RepID=UPI001C27789B|nr:putative late blight resistance protein homolog R1A-3 [Salvia splendens]
MAYALIVSLKLTLDPLLDSAQSMVHIHKPELKLIYDDLCYIKSFFDGMNSLRDRNSAEDLEKDIRRILEYTQDLIEAHLSNLAQSESQIPGDEISISRFSKKLIEVKDKLKAKKYEVAVLKAKKDEILKAKEELLKSQEEEDQQSPHHFGISSKIGFEKNKKTVGLQGEVSRLLDLLLSDNRRRTLISIGGMAGIGKTTLATEVYLHPFVEQHFHMRRFINIGARYPLEELLSGLLGQLDSTEMKELTVDELGLHLYQYLFGRRYLIVLDDMWNLEAWDEIRRFFPNNENGSRIICTSRLNGVCDAFYDRKLQKRFLDGEESWHLLCMIAFPDMQMCPLELEEIGRSITTYSDGLPAAIVEIGKVLSNSPPTLKSWTEITRNMSMILAPMISKLMSPSYAQLPQQLKACFLYLGLFQPNYNIPTSQLLRLWVAEGLIRPIAGKGLELTAEEYLHNLVSRNLVVVHELSSTGKIKTCRCHELVQNFCVNEARQEKLFHIVNKGFPQGTESLRRLGVHSNDVLGDFRKVYKSMELASVARSLLFVGPQHKHPVKVYLGFPWLRVLDALPLIFHRFPHKVTKLVRLRYLAITCDGRLPSSISTLLNLEVLIINQTKTTKPSLFMFLPLEIWKLQKLRHLECMGFDLPDPSVSYDSNFRFLYNLLTLSGVSTHSCTKTILLRMPRLIKLALWSHPTHNHAVEINFFNAVFTYLHKLESLKCVITNPGLVSRAPSYHIILPFSLRKITLSGCKFMWEKHMSISQLPFLQVLKLRCGAFCGPKWELCEGGFMHLKLLLLEDLDIEHLIADSDHLPVLQRLIIRSCYKLHEIPIGIGDIPSLQLIEVDDCSMSVIQSARDIKVEQEELGNEQLEVRIRHTGNETC